MESLLIWSLLATRALAFSSVRTTASRSPYRLTYAAVGGEDSFGSDGEEYSVWDSVGEMAARTLPPGPSAELSAESAIYAVIRGLQYNDVPSPDTGLTRCFAFMDLTCKKLVTGHGNVPEQRTLKSFMAYARESPKVRPFLSAKRVQFGEVQRNSGTPTRGEIVSMALQVWAPASPLVHASGLVRGALGSGETEQTFMIRLQKQRATGEYLVTDLVDVATVSSVSRQLNNEDAAVDLAETKCDDTEAVRLYQLAADKGDCNAQWNLGLMYEYGRGVAQSSTEAVRLIQTAAERGSADAQLHMGVRFEEGRGVSQSNMVRKPHYLSVVKPPLLIRPSHK